MSELFKVGILAVYIYIHIRLWYFSTRQRRALCFQLGTFVSPDDSASDILCCFLTPNSLRTIRWSHDSPTVAQLYLHVCRNANTTGPLNYLGHFWPFMFSFTVLLLILKVIVFPEPPCFILFFPDSHILSSLKSAEY